jgi:hypothetical protein
VYHCCSGKAVSIKHYECVAIALVIKHAMRMRHIILHVASVVRPYFSTLCHKRNEFRKKKITEHKMCFFIFSTTRV